MKQILIFLFFILVGKLAFGQQTVSKSLYYENDGYRLSQAQKSELKAFIDSVRSAAGSIEAIVLEGHTDSSASLEYNLRLARRRSAQVEKFILQKVVSNVPVQVRNHGETNPRYGYTLPGAMAKNRRVDVELVIATGLQQRHTTILDLYKLLETQADTFYIWNNRDTIVEGSRGTLLHVPAHTLCGMKNDNDRVKISLKEVMHRDEMISQNASTGSNKNLLVTGGMVQVLAWDLQNNPLQLCDNKSLTLMVPTQNPDSGMQMFLASRDSAFGLDWNLQNPDEKLEIVKGVLFRGCDDDPEDSFGSSGEGRCRFFFCKIRNAFQSASKAVLVRRKRKLSQAFAKYEMRSTVDNLVDLCGLKKQRMKDIEEKYNGINTTKLEELTLEEASYYIFNSTALGWVNCDRFLDLAPEQLTNLILPMRTSESTDVKLVLSADNAIMPSYTIEGKIGFPNVPKGAKATLLALRYEHGQPALAMQEVVIGEDTAPIELEYKDYTLSELKELLKRWR